MAVSPVAKSLLFRWAGKIAHVSNDDVYIRAGGKLKWRSLTIKHHLARDRKRQIGKFSGGKKSQPREKI